MPWQFNKGKYIENTKLAWRQLEDHCNKHFSLSEIKELTLITNEKDLKRGYRIEDANEFVDKCEAAIEAKKEIIVFVVQV